MEAVAVIPGKPNSVHLREGPKPQLENASNGRGVLVKVLRVGVDGTDKEINAVEYGAAPPGDDYEPLGGVFGLRMRVVRDLRECLPDGRAGLQGGRHDSGVGPNQWNRVTDPRSAGTTDNH